MKKYVFLYVTAPNMSEAESLGRTLVREQLAACVNILPSMQSIYRWKNNIESSKEVILIVKTIKALSEKAQKKILSQHPYEVPCVIEIPLGKISAGYEKWLNESLRVSAKSRK